MSPDTAARSGGESVIFVPPGGGRVYEQRGFRGAIKIDDAESGARQCFSEWSVDPGEEGPPPHLHREHQEAFFVVSGTLTFTVGGETYDAPAGSFLFIPPGVVHPFSNRTAEPAARGRPDDAELQRLSEKYDVFFA